MAPAGWVAFTGGVAGIRIDPKLEAACMDVVAQGLHPRRELCGVWLQYASSITRCHPAVIDVDILVPCIPQAAGYQGICYLLDEGLIDVAPACGWDVEG
jgi:hypothetical protein